MPAAAETVVSCTLRLSVPIELALVFPSQAGVGPDARRLGAGGARGVERGDQY